MIINVDGTKLTLIESEGLLTSSSFKPFISIKQNHEHKYTIVTDAFNVKASSFTTLIAASREALELSSQYK